MSFQDLLKIDDRFELDENELIRMVAATDAIINNPAEKGIAELRLMVTVQELAEKYHQSPARLLEMANNAYLVVEEARHNANR